MSWTSNMNEFNTLARIIARLRAPDGCPWDREQTHRSLRENLLSESYEVLEAIDGGKPDELCEELGDLLLQIVLHAQIAADDNEFKIDDVIEGISNKIVRRHPHVFGTGQAKNSTEVMHNWETIKRVEREPNSSMLDGVPANMPSLGYACEVQKRVARVGFDWEDTNGVIDKLVEEVKELQEAGTKEEKEQEYGDLFFTMANIARRDGIDPESALRRANRKFYRRFSDMEKMCRERGLSFDKLSFEQQNKLWEEAKKHIDI